MALQYSPKITTDGLVMCLDASNNKSYPTDLPVKNGLVMWMDAADDTTFSYSSGTTVSQWRDKSGFNYHMVPKSSGPTRSAVLNSRKVLAFTASQTIGNDVIDLTYTTSTVFVVSRYVAGTNQRVLTCNLDSSGGNWLLGHWGGYVNQYYAEGWVSYQVYGNDTVWRVYMGDYSGVNTDLANIYSNGTAIVTNSTAASGGLRKLGVNYYSGEMSTCEVAEIIVFNRVLSATERKQVNTYLGQKWGISNTDRQVFDLSGNNFNFSFNGTNPRYNAKSIVSNFNTTSPFAVSSYGGQNLTSTLLNLLYIDHTIEVAVNLKGFKAVKSFDNARDYEGAAGIVLWQGYHSGLYVDAATEKLTYLIWNATPDYVAIEYALPNDLKDKILYITAKRQANVLSIFINGLLVAGPTSITTTVRSYSQINIGAAFQGDPSSGTLGSFVWAGQHEYHLLRMYSRALATSELVSNYQAFKARFDNNIVRFGLVLDLDAGNIYSYAGAGTVWYDVSGNSYNGTLIGSPVYTSNNNGGIIFDSVAKYVTLPASGLAFGTGQFAIEAWVFSTAAVSYNHVYSSQSSNNVGFISLYYQNGYGFSIADLGNSAVRTATTHQTVVSQNTWYHVVGIRNASNQYIVYVNGVESTTNSTSSYPLTATAPQIASNPASNTERFTGTIASFRLYNTSLSAAQVLQNYNATKGRFGL
jgi:hypothetical protein